MGFQLKDGLYIINQKELETLQQVCETKRRDVVEAYIEKLITTRKADQVVQEKNKKIADYAKATEEDNQLFQKIRSENKYLLNVNLTNDEPIDLSNILKNASKKEASPFGKSYDRTINILTDNQTQPSINNMMPKGGFNIILPQQAVEIWTGFLKGLSIDYYEKRNKAVQESGLKQIAKDYIFADNHKIKVLNPLNNAFILGGNKNDEVRLISENNDAYLRGGRDKAELVNGSGLLDLGAGSDQVTIEGGRYTITLGTGSDHVSLINSGDKKDLATIIKDFDVSEDKFVLANRLSLGEVEESAYDLSRFMTLLTSYKITDNPSGAILSFDGNNSVQFENVSKAQLEKALEIRLNNEAIRYTKDHTSIENLLDNKIYETNLNSEFTQEKLLPSFRFEVSTVDDPLTEGETISHPIMKKMNEKELKALSQFPNYKDWGFLLNRSNYSFDSSYDIQIKDEIILKTEDDIKRISESMRKNKDMFTAAMWENKLASFTVAAEFSVLNFFKNTLPLQKAKKHKEAVIEAFPKDRMVAMHLEDDTKEITFNYKDILNNGTFKSSDENLEVKYLFVHYQSSTPKSAVLYDSKIEDLQGNKPLAGRALITGHIMHGWLRVTEEGEYKSLNHNGHVMAYDISKGIDRVIAQGIAGNAHKGVDDKTKIRLAFGLHNKETNKIVVTPFSNSCVISQ